MEYGPDFKMNINNLLSDQPYIVTVKGQPLLSQTLPALIVRKLLKWKDAPKNPKLTGEYALAFSDAMARIGASQKDSLPLDNLRNGLVRAVCAVWPFVVSTAVSTAR